MVTTAQLTYKNLELDHTAMEEMGTKTSVTEYPDLALWITKV